MKAPKFLHLFKFAVAGLVTASFVTTAQAAPLLTNSGTGSVFNNTGTFGFAFTLATNATLTSLGIYDAANSGGTQGDGLLDSHEIQLYLQNPLDSNLGTLIASVTFSSGATGADAAGFIFAAPTFGSGISLVANSTYVLGATNYTTGGTHDNFRYNDNVSNAPTVSSGVTLLSDRHNASNAFPSSGFGGIATVGPNLQLLAVPEPSTWAALLGGAGLLGGFRILRRRP